MEMIHIRAVSPPDLSDRLVGVLAADPAVVNLVVLPGAARNPDGDAVECDLLTGVACAYALWREARGSLLQLLLNIVVLIVVGFLTLRVQRFIWRRVAQRRDRAEPAVPSR